MEENSSDVLEEGGGGQKETPHDVTLRKNRFSSDPFTDSFPDFIMDLAEVKIEVKKIVRVSHDTTKDFKKVAIVFILSYCHRDNT